VGGLPHSILGSIPTICDLIGWLPPWLCILLVKGLDASGGAAAAVAAGAGANAACKWSAG
jgi:hypothetical protein